MEFLEPALPEECQMELLKKLQIVEEEKWKKITQLVENFQYKLLEEIHIEEISGEIPNGTPRRHPKGVPPGI